MEKENMLMYIFLGELNGKKQTHRNCYAMRPFPYLSIERYSTYKRYKNKK
jgi:hypothetical protein